MSEGDPNTSRVSPVEGEEDSPLSGLMGRRVEETMVYMNHPSDVPTDTYNITPDHVDLEFNSIFREPLFYLKSGSKYSYFIGERVIRIFFKAVFTYTQLGIYYLLCLLLGFFVAVVWGFLYGVMEWVVIWIINPVLKVLLAVFRLLFVLNKALARSCLDPWCQSIGLLFSFMRLQVSNGSGGGRLPLLPIGQADGTAMQASQSSKMTDM